MGPTDATISVPLDSRRFDLVSNQIKSYIDRNSESVEAAGELHRRDIEEAEKIRESTAEWDKMEPVSEKEFDARTDVMMAGASVAAAINLALRSVKDHMRDLSFEANGGCESACREVSEIRDRAIDAAMISETAREWLRGVTASAFWE